MRRAHIRNSVWIPCIGLAILSAWGSVGVALGGDIWLAGCLISAALFFLLVPVVDAYRDDEVAPAADASPTEADALLVVDAPGVVSTAQIEREAA